MRRVRHLSTLAFAVVARVALVAVGLGGIPSIAQAQSTGALLHGGDPGSGEHRGTSVACSADGTRVAIGSPVFGARMFASVGGVWALENEVRPVDLHHHLGAAVALSADARIAAVGAPTPATGGTVEIWARTGGDWSVLDTLLLDGEEAGNDFGAALALSADGTRLVVGAPGTLHRTGSATLWERGPGGWAVIATLAASEPAPLDRFGTSVAISADGRVVVVGAPGADGGRGRRAGAAWVFQLDATGTGLARVRLASGSARGDLLGASVGVSADGARFVVGAPRADTDAGTDAGEVYVIESWPEGLFVQATLIGSRRGAALGAAVAIDASGTHVLGVARDGLVRGLERSRAGWATVGGIGPTEASVRPRSTPALAFCGDLSRAVLGAPDAPVAGVDASGGAFVFSTRPGDAPASFRPDATLAPELAVPHERRLGEQQFQLGAAGVGLGIAGMLGSVGVLLAGTTCRSHPAESTWDLVPVTCGSDVGFVIAGAVTGAVGLAALLTGVVVIATRPRGPSPARFALLPSTDGMTATFTTSF